MDFSRRNSTAINVANADRLKRELKDLETEEERLKKELSRIEGKKQAIMEQLKTFNDDRYEERVLHMVYEQRRGKQQ